MGLNVSQILADELDLDGIKKVDSLDETVFSTLHSGSGPQN